MTSFDKIIGYDTIKEEMLQIIDMIHRKDEYKKLGAKLPSGVLLYGDPGLGKTLMAKSFIEEAALPTYTLRRDKGTDDFIGTITATFDEAAKHAPSVIFLDDMDKFANEDDTHTDAEEYVAIQSGIDAAKGRDVFLIATANNIHKLPASLTRSGRFDRRIHIQRPSRRDAEHIIAYYLRDKKVSADVNMDDLSKMINYRSCADLETILNEAAIKAAYERSESIGMRHLLAAVLRRQYTSPDNLTSTDPAELEMIAVHEAGHAVVSEVLCPGSVGLISIRSTGRDSDGGFTHLCKPSCHRIDRVLTGLGGKAAVELRFAKTCASGCQRDLYNAYSLIREGIADNATAGFSGLDVSGPEYPVSQRWLEKTEDLVHAELEHALLQTRNILLENKEFLEKLTAELMEKETLLYSDIRRVRESCG